jgi:hypothetical protein
MDIQRPSSDFVAVRTRVAATKYLQDFAQKKSIKDDAVQLRMLDPLTGGLDLG